MTTFAIGAATVTRIEETYEPNFDAAEFFPDWRPETVQQPRTGCCRITTMPRVGS